MLTTPWWSQAVFYQIYPLSFQDTSGNGIGDLQGIIQRLGYLEDLGVDALWISPCFPSPWADWGYDVSDYTNIHPGLGTLDTMDRLLQAAHARGLHVLLDFVPNHTSDQHVWFQQSRKGRENPKREWYLWREPGEHGGPPNNWLSYFGGPAWEWDAASRQYYLHSFLREQPDLNWRNPEVRQAMQDVLRFWLDRGVDGFRVDAVLPIIKSSQFEDNPAGTRPLLGRDIGPAGWQERLHNTNQPEIHALLREWRELLNSYPDDRMLVGEVYTLDTALAGKYYGRNDELHLVLNLSLVNLPWDAELMRTYVEGFEAGLPPNAQSTVVLGSHDEPRLASRLGERQARGAAMLLLTLRGAPFIYYGDEIGMLDMPIPIDRQRDPWPKIAGLPHLSRDPARTPMQWDATPGAGFSQVSGTSTAEPWLPIHPDYRQRNVRTELDDPNSLLNLYRQLLRLRRSCPALHAGSYQGVAEVPAGTYMYYRLHPEQSILVALNFGADERLLQLSDPRRGRLLLSSGLDREGEIDLGHFVLRGHEGIVIQLHHGTARVGSERATTRRPSPHSL
jgi:alpha-glucosidase